MRRCAPRPRAIPPRRRRGSVAPVIAFSASIRTVRSRRSAVANGRARAGSTTIRRGASSPRSSPIPAASSSNSISRATAAALRADRPGALRAATGQRDRLRSIGSKAMAAACGCRFSTPPAVPRPTAAGAISTTRSRARISASAQSSIVLDFNYAYNPSCAYDERWSCPLSPPENRLPFAVTAGEKNP